MDLKHTEAKLRQEVARTIQLTREILEELRQKYGMYEPAAPVAGFIHNRQHPDYATKDRQEQQQAKIFRVG